MSSVRECDAFENWVPGILCSQRKNLFGLLLFVLSRGIYKGGRGPTFQTSSPFYSTSFHTQLPHSPLSQYNQFKVTNTLHLPNYHQLNSSSPSSVSIIFTIHATSILSALLAVSIVSASPALKPRGVQCGVHITQHQKNEDGVGADYQFDANMVNKDGLQIGSLSRQPIPAQTSHAVSSPLGDLLITAFFIDSDPIQFEFQGFTFASDSSNCNFGGYDGGARQGDCSFSC